ncbi:MAG: aminoacyl-tRNA deacylase [Vulcanisaeta sp. AZ3]
MVKTSKDIVMGVPVEVLEFEQGVETVESASRESGEPISKIVKTLLIKAGNEYAVMLVRGDKRVDLNKLSQLLGKEVVMAKAKEVKQVLGVEVGAVTPLSEHVKLLKVIMDPSILENEYILCGGGSKNKLFRVNVKDLVQLLKPEFLDAFTQVS